MDCKGTGWRRDSCLACAGRGVLWLGGGEYMECPECSGKGYPPKVKQTFIPGTVLTAGRDDRVLKLV